MEFPYYPWYSKDFAGDSLVMAMTNMQELIYRRLLDRSWELGGLPNDPAALSRLSEVRPTTFRKAWTFPLTDCWESNDEGRLVNPRQEKDRVRITGRKKLSAYAAKKRWEKVDKPLSTNDRADASALPEQCVRNRISESDPESDSDADLTLRDQALRQVTTSRDLSLPGTEASAGEEQLSWKAHWDEEKKIVSISDRFRSELKQMFLPMIGSEKEMLQVKAELDRYLIVNVARRPLTRSAWTNFVKNWFRIAADRAERRRS